MSHRKQVVFGVVAAVAGLGLTSAMFHNVVIMVASAVWGY
jgi:hypothetical protein